MILNKIYKKIIYFLFKNKKFKSEDEYYKFLFTYNPSWNSITPNEDEKIRWHFIKEQIDKHLTNKNNLKNLEIGSGRGWLTNLLNSEYGDTIGVEPVSEVVKYAKSIYPNIKFYTSGIPSILNLFKNEKFDLIICSEVIEHISDKSQFFSCCKLLLNPVNGVLILTTPRSEHYSAFVEAYGSDPSQPVEEWLTENELKNLIQQSDLDIVEIKFFNRLPIKDKEILINQLFVCRIK